MKDIASQSPTRPSMDRSIQDACSVLSLQIHKRFDRTKPAFDLNVTAEIRPGITIVFGPSGAGKTTLLECIAGLLTPNSGRIVIGNRIFFDGSHKVDVDVRQRRIGYVFQDLALFPHLTVEKNIAYGIRSSAFAVREREVGDILDSFRIAGLRGRKPSEISGGERQRVALARSLVTDPYVLLLDEPLAALDSGTKQKIIDDLRTWNDAHCIPVLYVTHSREEVFALGNHVLMLEAGRIIAQGAPNEIVPR